MTGQPASLDSTESSEATTGDRSTRYDGCFYATGLDLFKAPKQTAKGVTLGFHVAVFNDEDHAEAVADALNRDDATEMLVAACKACLEDRGDWVPMMTAALSKAEGR